MSFKSQTFTTKEEALQALTHDDLSLRYHAAWWLGNNRVAEACLPLCQALKDEDDRNALGGYPLRREAARALGHLKNKAAVPALIEALDCREDIKLRQVVAQTLGILGDAQAQQPIFELLKSPQEQPWEAIIEALASLEMWEARLQVEKFLDHSSERVKCAAHRYLYLMTKEYEYLEYLLNTLNHNNSMIRWAALYDLGAIGSVEVVSSILEADVATSLKLVNFKRIFEQVTTNDQYSPKEREEKEIVLIDAIDQLLIRL
jgi:bilin biosynthesis PecE protein